ncbi:MAG: ATP-binding protein, partial [Pararheinheimera sp.]|nr:ATP-binding protein [Rheinheimera sp.]
NPSPSGHHKDGRSTPEQIRRYLSRLSGPFLDRIELQVEVPLLPKGSLSQHKTEESSLMIKQRVEAARAVQQQRQGKANAKLNLTELGQHCQLEPTDADYFEHCLTQLKLSARSYHKLLKVARTLADLAGRPQIERNDLLEALSYRSFDRLLNYLQS